MPSLLTIATVIAGLVGVYALVRLFELAVEILGEVEKR